MRRGFTLAETLTVLMIVLIITAATYPVFFQARARAKQTICESTLRQVYLGIELYSQDYDTLPYLAHDDPNWYKRYTGGVIFRCPNTLGQERRVDYQIMAGPVPDAATNSASRHWSDLLAQCRDKRGMDFPYAFDPNHHRKVDGYQGAGQRVILVRASGAIANVPYRNEYGTWLPCDRELGLDIQH